MSEFRRDAGHNPEGVREFDGTRRRDSAAKATGIGQRDNGKIGTCYKIPIESDPPVA